MDSREDGAPGADHLDRDLSLQEAARLYDVALRTLRNRVRWGQIPAYKSRGAWGPEWRVSSRSLEAFGLRPRVMETLSENEDPRVASLQAELASLRRSLAAEHDRANQADRELGYAMLECGRLRSALEKSRRHVDTSADGSPHQPPRAATDTLLELQHGSSAFGSSRGSDREHPANGTRL